MQELSIETPSEQLDGDESQKGRLLFGRFDILVMLGAIVTLFLASGSEPWWTLTGTTASKLFNFQVSPFFVKISGTGLSSTVPFAASLGSLTRTLLLVGSVALFAASIRPTAWWRNLAVTVGISSLVELYLSFVLMFYWAENLFADSYGVLPPYFGTSTLQTTVLGLDLAYYASPVVTATFNVSYYIGFISIGLLAGRTIIRILQDRAFRIIAALVPGGAIHDIRLSPPYQQVWFSNEDEQYNPMRKYLGGVADDQLIVSFSKLFDTVQPGGSLSIILPEGSTILFDKLQKLMPNVGFLFEESNAITSEQGKPETELHFKRPEIGQSPAIEKAPTLQQAIPEPPAVESPSSLEIPEMSMDALTIPEPTSPGLEEIPAELESRPPTLEIAGQPPTGSMRMTKLERSILKSAIRAINEHQQPVPYRELLNEVYMDLVDQKTEFDSAKQIETTLLDHSGQEIVVLEEPSGTGTHVIKKWGLGEKKMRPDRNRGIPVLKQVKSVGPKLAGIRRIIASPRNKSRYQSEHAQDDDNTAQ